MSRKVTENYLIGLTSYPEVLNAFPWMQTLANKYKVSFGKGCGGCKQKRTVRAVTDQVNNCIQILATIPEAELNRFKQLVKQDKLTLSYRNTRGEAITVTR